MPYVSPTGAILRGNEAYRAREHEVRDKYGQLKWLGLFCLLCVFLNPSQESLNEFMSHRTGSNISASLSRLVRGTSFEKSLLWSTASSGGENFIGILGNWFPVPQFPKNVFNLPSFLQKISDVDIVLTLYIAVFASWFLLPATTMYQHFTVMRGNLRSWKVHTLITSAFSHADVVHLAMNAQILLSVGHEVAVRVSNGNEELRWHFYLLYGSSALAGNAASLVWHSGDYCALGASGALYGLWGYLVAASGGAHRVLWYGQEFSAAQAFLANLVLSSSLSYAGVSSTDNAMHVGGALWGAVVFPVILEHLSALGL